MTLITRVWEQMSNAAKKGWNVCIQGETGTGKEVVARGIASLRAKRPMVAIACGAISSELFESTLFGTVKGAYNGAFDKPGFIETAADGILFLDEVGSLAEYHQAKLLRAVDPDIREFSRVGETLIRKAKCMFISANLVSLRQLVDNKSFRPDLAFRLGARSIVLPPLRERRADIPLLIDYFLTKSNNAGNTLKLTSEIIHTFEQGVWPGNVRSVRHLIETIVGEKESGLVTLDDVRRIVGKKELADLLGDSSDAGSTPMQKASVATMTVPIEPQQLWTQLSTEISYGEPGTWLELGKRPNDDSQDEEKIFAVLKSLLNDSGWSLLQGFKLFLENRENKKNPRPIHHYKALLYLALHPHGECDLRDFERILGLRSWKQKEMVGKELALFGSGASQSLVYMKEAERNRKVYRLNACILKDASSEALAVGRKD